MQFKRNDRVDINLPSLKWRQRVLHFCDNYTKSDEQVIDFNFEFFTTQFLACRSVYLTYIDSVSLCTHGNNLRDNAQLPCRDSEQR